MFIELTLPNNKGKFIGNVKLLQRVTDIDGKAYVIGWDNNGGFDVEETYEEVIKIIESCNEYVLRK